MQGIRQKLRKVRPFLKWRRRIRNQFLAWWYHGDLTRLARLYKTDKWGHHWYAAHYARHFQSLRHQRLRILEIGVGGYSHPRFGGHALRLWKAYFPNSWIYGLDCYDKEALEEPRITVFQGSQDDPDCLRRVAHAIGGIDIVIDDGSHVNRHVMTAFQTLFPLLNPHGIYVIEDTQTSYWPGLGGSSDDLNRPTTIMGFFKSLVDGLNYEEFIKPGYTPSFFDQHIVAMHFYHNLVFVMKGQNTEGSNAIRDFTTDQEWMLTDYRKAEVYSPQWHEKMLALYPIK
ncbi:MAG: class I SAM-dependent methyltransferase [Candidatus Omnitrophica bacterium]|nr:class I SAM-dependent methyltransferase [Candidatus Omnitrophota bacterium]